MLIVVCDTVEIWESAILVVPGGGITEEEVQAMIAAALEDYYTQEEVDQAIADAIAGGGPPAGFDFLTLDGDNLTLDGDTIIIPN